MNPYITTCTCRRCRKGDPGGCLTLEAIHADQVARGIIPADQYHIVIEPKIIIQQED